MKISRSPLAILIAALPFTPAAAQAESTVSRSEAEAASGAEPAPGSADKAHPHADEAIVVTGVRRSAQDVLGGVSVIDRDALTAEARPSLGETLQDQPGVSASSFGPTASRPILRGLSGERVRVLVDGIGSLDLSATDPDHAVAVNPLTAERIEVLRGPSALLFGSSAIGGVVNVIDTRIPRRAPDRAIAVDALGILASAADERSIAVAANVPLGGSLVGHLDGSYSKYDDLRVGGYVLSEPLRKQAAASPEPEIRALADLRHRLPNSGGRLADVAGGLALAAGDLNIGASVTHHSARYGVPVRFALEPGVEAERPTIDARQDRADLRIASPLGGLFKSAELRAGASRYRHKEIEENGEVGSRFFSDGAEARFQLVQSERSGWGGTSGAQWLDQDARIRGEEKYLPDSRNRQFGLFTLQTLERGALRVEGGLRVEFARLNADEDERIAEIVEQFDQAFGGAHDIGEEQVSRAFTSLSASAGLGYEFTPGWRVGLSLSHSERAPSVDELFSFGPHGGSQQFLVGDPGLSREKSNAAELRISRSKGPVHLQASAYFSRFSNFIYQAPTDEMEDDLPVYEYRQGKADYYGFEVGGDARLGRALSVDWGAELVADHVRATIRRFGPAPLIPPLRVLGALTGKRGQIDGRIELERAWPQRRTAPNETETAGYTLLNAAIDWHPFAARPELTLSLQGDNLFDVLARRHSSVLKDYAPLAGRDVRLTARLAF